MLYPLLFTDNYKDYLWGGRRLSELGKNLPDDQIVAESWEISAHPHGMSIVKNGAFKGTSLADLTASHGRELLGSCYQEGAKFPLLIKLIDAKNDLSVQVHPTDEWAQAHNYGPNGKSEMWYVIAAPANAKLVAGLKEGTTETSFETAIKEQRCEDVLAYSQVKVGDVINIPAGLVHAITAGLMVYEVQQSCDITFRVYDYNRRGADGKLRDLHIQESLACSRYDWANLPKLFNGINVDFASLGQMILGQGQRSIKVLNRHFCFEKWDLAGVLAIKAMKNFHALTLINGNLEIIYQEAAGTYQNVSLQKGQSVLLPACLKNFTLQGDQAELLVSTIADSADLEDLLKAAKAKLLVEPNRLVGLEPPL